MNPEIYKITWNGHTIESRLDHAESVDILKKCGHEIPKIPDGCNTVIFHFEYNGKPAVCINQRGFSRELKDNEKEVNGCAVHILLSETENPREILDQFAREMLEIK